MSLNSFITLGRSGLRVSPFCLGSMTFGEDLGWGASVADSEAMIAAYLERGGNFIDTANVYTNGHSEKIIGDFFTKKKGSRDRVVIGTKFCCSLFEGDPNGGGAGRKALMQQCEASLRRLQTDYIDIYWLHIWDHTAPIEETLRGLEDLVASGKVRYIGFSDLTDDRAFPGLGAHHCRAAGIFPAGAHRRGRAVPDGAGDGHGHHALVAAQARLPVGQIPPRQRRFGRYQANSNGRARREGLYGH